MTLVKVNLVEVIYAIIGVTLVRIIGASFGPYAEWGVLVLLLGVALFLGWRSRKSE